MNFLKSLFPLLLFLLFATAQVADIAFQFSKGVDCELLVEKEKLEKETKDGKEEDNSPKEFKSLKEEMQIAATSNVVWVAFGIKNDETKIAVGHSLKTFGGYSNQEKEPPEA